LYQNHLNQFKFILLNKDLISSSLPVLALNDTVLHAQEMMNEHHIFHLPVVNEDRYVGLIKEDELLNIPDERLLIEALSPRFSKMAVPAQAHFSEAVQIANEYGLSVVPVIELINHEPQWVGAISAEDLLKYLGRITGADEPGGIIVLEIERNNFTFSEIGKIVETNDAQITQLNTYYDNQLQVLILTLKINKFEVSDIVATFQRYEYNVKYYFGEELYQNELRSNYDHLMNYLKM
jgi:acetoin utilization protein AcuB